MEKNIKDDISNNQFIENDKKLEKYQGELMNQEMVNQNINFNFPNDGRF